MSSFNRKFVASAFADANAYLVMANVIATMDISKAQDERGFQINPPHAYKSGFTQYVMFFFFLGVHLIPMWYSLFAHYSHLYPFKCTITPRSKKVVDLIVQLNAANSC